MDRSVCRAMVAVAGMAVLGMTATPAGARTHPATYSLNGQSLADETPANVNTSPEGAMPREVWVVATAGGAPRKVGAGDSPTFSPDGTRLLFVDKKRSLTISGEHL